MATKKYRNGGMTEGLGDRPRGATRRYLKLQDKLQEALEAGDTERAKRLNRKADAAFERAMRKALKRSLA
jgi:hypothetical protein